MESLNRNLSARQNDVKMTFSKIPLQHAHHNGVKQAKAAIITFNMWIRFCLLLALELALSSCLSLAFAESWRRQPKRNSWSKLRGGDDGDNQDVLPPAVPSCELPPVWGRPKRALVFMDKFTPYFGFYLSKICREAYGVAAINVFSDYMIGYFLKEHKGLQEPLSMGIPSEETLQEWKSQLPVDEIVGIICESDSGLADAERFGVMLGLQNHDGINEARRNKYLMVEQVGDAGLAVVRQKLCYTPEEAVEFAKQLGVGEEQSEAMPRGAVETSSSPEEDSDNDDTDANTGSLGKATNVHHDSDTHMCIVKPIRGAATDSVFLCKSLNDVTKAFDLIYGMPIFGSPQDSHNSVLIQEFASGTEYALDIVSKNGHHKVAALWRYDKRPANGASFVYHATEVIDADTELGRRICDYAKQALDALGITWGQTHTEVIVGAGQQPRLVEVNCVRSSEFPFVGAIS